MTEPEPAHLIRIEEGGPLISRSLHCGERERSLGRFWEEKEGDGRINKKEVRYLCFKSGENCEGVGMWSPPREQEDAQRAC